MDRTACIDLPALPLQLLLRRHPDWRDHPAAVVERDKPQALILWANRAARRRRIQPGMRYATGLTLAAELRAGVISASEIATGVDGLAERLHRFSPAVEPAPDEPGVFWLDASGLEKLFGSVEEWAEAMRRDIDGEGWRATLVVGWTRFGTYALARAGAPGARRAADASRLLVLPDPEEERRRARRVRLASLGIAPALRDALARLGVHDVAGLLRLPPEGLLERYGTAAQRLHRLASDELWTPLQARAFEEAPLQRLEMESPETDLTRLLFQIKPALDALLATLAERHEALAALRLELTLDRGGTRSERIGLAAPGLDPRPILNLVYLRLEGFPLTSGVVEVALGAQTVPATREQLRLFHFQQRRDLEAADRALARVRAEFGDECVVRARLEEGHLPEASFSWEPAPHAHYPRAPHNPTNGVPRAPHNPTNGVPRARDPGERERPLVRRLFSRPIRLPPRPRQEPDGWLLLGAGHGHVEESLGPYVVSGGWWVRPVRRDYYFARTRDGEIFWIYYDRRRRRWFLQGRVE